MEAARILVIEDNHNLALGLSNNLKLEGYQVAVAEDGRKGLELTHGYCPHAIVLDLMLPKMDGYQVLRTIRSDGLDTPVLIMTALGDEADKVRGFRMGADQYLTKPFSVVEFLSRVEALLRRSPMNGSTRQRSLERFGDVTVDIDARVVSKSGAQISLTPKAFELLLALMRRDGAVATRHDLLREIWGYEQSVVSRTVDAHVAELRRKLEPDPGNPKYILTVWKCGYRFEH